MTKFPLLAAMLVGSTYAVNPTIGVPGAPRVARHVASPSAARTTSARSPVVRPVSYRRTTSVVVRSNSSGRSTGRIASPRFPSTKTQTIHTGRNHYIRPTTPRYR
jgi:hypothetical protein